MGWPQSVSVPLLFTEAEDRPGYRLKIEFLSARKHLITPLLL